MKKLFHFLFLSLLSSLLFAQWNFVHFIDAGGIYSASSELEKPEGFNEIGRYSPKNLFDDNPATAWVEGEKGPGIGSYVLVGVKDFSDKYIIIYNGYQQSESLFKKNNRVKDLKISLYAGFTWDEMVTQTGFNAYTVQYNKSEIIHLQDQMGQQKFTMPFSTDSAAKFLAKEADRCRKENKKYKQYAAKVERAKESFRSFFIFKFEILSVYKGSKWDDTCLAGIELSGNPNSTKIQKGVSIIKIRPDSSGRKLALFLSDGRKILLADAETIAYRKGYTEKDEFLTFSIMDVSPDNEWAIIDYQHGFTGGGSIDETHHLWSLRRTKEVSSALLKRYNIDDPLGFAMKAGRLHLEAMNGTSIILADIALDLDSGRF